MRQFILASGYSEEFAAGKVGLVGNNLVYWREDAQGGNILFPVAPQDMTVVAAVYSAGATFTAKFTIPEITPFLDYTVTFVKKGLQFNERSNWSACVHATATDTADTIAAKIAKYVENNATTLGLTAVAEGATVTVTAKKEGVPYTITFGDELYGLEATDVVEAKTPFMNAAMIKDLFNKAAADRGYEYTYDDFDIYPGFEFNPLKAADAADTGFSVFTIRFAESRKVGTRKDDVYQIIQVAFPYDVNSSEFINAIQAYGDTVCVLPDEI